MDVSPSTPTHPAPAHTEKVCAQCGATYPANARFCETDGTALRFASGGVDLEGSIIADRYLILKRLGEGGMGRVYLAEHVKMGRKSALKVLHPGMVKDVGAITRFNREAANASRVSHPNVAVVYDFGETPDGLIYLAMEYVDGVSLAKVVEELGALPPKRAAEIIRQTSEALSVAHDIGLVHRDLKPDNILLAKTRDGTDLVKVVDFGIAKAADSEEKVTKTGHIIGTPDYMSPEQIAGDKLDARSDIYSLGLVAFDILAGRLPFSGESAQESMIMRLTDKPETLKSARADVDWPTEVQVIIGKALERDRAKRFQSASEFGRALYKAIERMPAPTPKEATPRSQSAVPPTRVGSARAIEPPKSKNVGLIIGVIAALIVVAALMIPVFKHGAISERLIAAAAAVGDPSPEFDRLDRLANDSSTAAAALTSLAAIPLASDEHHVRAALVRFAAKLSLADHPAACDALKQVRTIAPGTTKATLVANKLKDLCSD